MPARSSQPDTPELGIGMVGYAFMGAAHSRAWATVAQAFDVPLRPRMAALAGRDRAATRAAAHRFGWRHAETDWRALIDRDDVQLVDICSPGDTHAEIAIAALDAGKHVLCEKPLANTLAEAETMADAAARAARNRTYPARLACAARPTASEPSASSIAADTSCRPTLAGPNSIP